MADRTGPALFRVARVALAAVACGVIPAAALAEEIDMDALAALPPADVVILGEIHDNADHHLAQARAMTALRPAAVVFEMLSPEQAGRLTLTARADLEGLAALLDWEQSGWPAFDLYAPVFAALGEAVVYGAAVPRQTVRAAFTDGAAAAFDGDAAAFGLTETLPEDQRALREEGQYLSHCEAMPREMMGGMVEAQRLRDAAFARTIAYALAETGGPVVGIMGAGHARIDWGVPWSLERVVPGADILSVGLLEAPPETIPPYDLWLVTEPAERDDPCAALR